MHTSEQCQGKGCDRKSQCERYVDTKNWPFPVMSKLCDSRFVAFLQKERSPWDTPAPDHIADIASALADKPEPQPLVFITPDGKGGMKFITEAEAF